MNDRVPVASSFLSSVGYDPDQQVLSIEFASGKVIRYRGVPAEIHQELMDAESKGKYFGSVIRRNYQHEVEEAALSLGPGDERV